MAQYFVTYQPQSVAEKLKTEHYSPNNNTYAEIKNEFGYNPIFFIPIRNKLDFYIKNFFTTPSKPDVMIITKLDKYDCIDAAKWYEQKGNQKKHKILREIPNSDRELEYISDKISPENVQEVIEISKFNLYSLLPPSFPAELASNFTNPEIITKLLAVLEEFWKVIEKYIELNDERDMVKFTLSPEIEKLNVKYEKILGCNTIDLNAAIKSFRTDVEKIAKNFDWFL